MFAEAQYERSGARGLATSDPLWKEVEAIRQIETIGVTASDAVICVSHAQARFLSNFMNVPPMKISVVWNHTDVARFAYALRNRDRERHRLGISDRLVLVYCGSARKHQRLDKGITLFKALKRATPAAYLLVLTQDPKKALELLRTHSVDDSDSTVVTAPFPEVPQLMCAGDIGLITRGLGEDACLANQASSPVKFAEYLAAGLPIFLSEGIGDYSVLVKQHGLGVVFPSSLQPKDTEAAIAEFLTLTTSQFIDMRQRCREYAETHFDEVAYIPMLERIHNPAIAAPPTAAVLR